MSESKLFSGQFRVRIPKSLHARLAAQAVKEGVSLNTYVIMLLSTHNVAHEMQRIAPMTKSTDINSNPVSIDGENILLGNSPRVVVDSSIFYFNLKRVQ